MSLEASSNVVAPPILFYGTNYQVWIVRMEAYLDANNQWEAIENEYEVDVRPEKFQFMEKWQNRNFNYEIVITVKKFIISSLDLG